MLCANLTGDPAQDVLVESIARDLIRLLGRNSGLIVPLATSSFAYQGRHVDTRQVARELNVTHVLECSLQLSQGGLRVAVELGDGATGEHLWSDSYELRAGDIQNQQAMLAASLAQRVAPGIQAGPTTGLIPEPPTAERARALDYFVQANGIVGATEANLRKAHDLYTRAIEQDPTFAPAFAARATTRLVQASFGYVLVEAVREAERDAREAVKLDPSLAEARATLGMVHGISGRWLQAEQEMEQASNLDSRNWQTLSRHALLLATVGKLQDALKEAKKAHEELAPLAMPAMMRHAIVLSTLGQDDEAMRFVDSVTRMGGVTAVGEIATMQSLSAFRAGRPAEAASRLLPVVPPAARAEGADVVIADVFEAAAAGKPADMAQAAKELRALTQRLSVDALDWSHGQLLMLLYALVGDFDSAFDAARHSLDYFGTADVLGPWYYALWLPELSGLRRDDRFHGLIERLHLPDYWNAYGPPDVPGCEWRDRALRCT
jgi:TolB-like protein/Tfp pilus assembly protein PilF